MPEANGAFGARGFTAGAPAGAVVLGTTDGFYRRVDTDGPHTPDSLFTPFLEQGLPAALGQLRQREASAQAQVPMSAKRADDASAILWRAPAHPC